MEKKRRKKRKEKKADQHSLTENKHVKRNYIHTHTIYTQKSRVKKNTRAKLKPLSNHKQFLPNCTLPRTVTPKIQKHKKSAVNTKGR